MSEPVKQLKPEPKKEQSDLIKEELKPKKETKAPVPVQELIIKEPEKTAKATAEKEKILAASIQAMTEQFNLEQAHLPMQEPITKELEKTTKATAAEEQDLAALIRAVTEQFNRDQARQQREVGKRAEQDILQAQTNKGDEKEKQANASNEAVNFLEEQASWLHGQKPNTSVPLPVWRNTTARSGDVFTVLLELHVDKNGYITEVQLLQSSDNKIIDAVAMVQVRAGQLNPFQQNGLLVNGIVPITLRYERP